MLGEVAPLFGAAAQSLAAGRSTHNGLCKVNFVGWPFAKTREGTFACYCKMCIFKLKEEF